MEDDNGIRERGGGGHIKPPDSEGSEDDSMSLYEVPLASQPLEPTIFRQTLPHERIPEILPASRWVRHCVALLGVAQGWVPELHPAHSTVVHSMTWEQMGPPHPGAIVEHGQASREQT